MIEDEYHIQPCSCPKCRSEELRDAVYDVAMRYCELMREFDGDMPYPNVEEVPFKEAAIADLYKELKAACRRAKEGE